jgi:hypothetical protein
MGVHEVGNGGRVWPHFQKADELFCDPLRNLSRLSWQDGSLAASRQTPEVRADFGGQVQRDDIEVRANDFLKFCMTSGTDGAEELQGLRPPPTG